MFYVPSMRANPSDAATVGPDSIDAGTSGNGDPSGQRTVARSAFDRRDRLTPELTTSAPGGNLVPDSFRKGTVSWTIAVPIEVHPEVPQQPQQPRQASR